MFLDIKILVCFFSVSSITFMTTPSLNNPESKSRQGCQKFNAITQDVLHWKVRIKSVWHSTERVYTLQQMKVKTHPCDKDLSLKHTLECKEDNRQIIYDVNSHSAQQTTKIQAWRSRLFSPSFLTLCPGRTQTAGTLTHHIADIFLPIRKVYCRAEAQLGEVFLLDRLRRWIGTVGFTHTHTHGGNHPDLLVKSFFFFFCYSKLHHNPFLNVCCKLLLLSFQSAFKCT